MFVALPATQSDSNPHIAFTLVAWKPNSKGKKNKKRNVGEGRKAAFCSEKRNRPRVELLYKYKVVAQGHDLNDKRSNALSHTRRFSIALQPHP